MTFGLGSWRFVLAFFVAISHLWIGMFGGPAAYAVWGFFVLSGFLMTEILRNKYGFTIQGLQKYAFNRFLRIFPLYYLSCFLSLVTLIIFSNIGMSFIWLNPAFYIPSNFVSWFGNFTLLPISSVSGLLVPVSGALAVEVGAYILIPFMAYSRNAAWLGATLALLLNFKYGMSVEMFPLRYSDFLTGYFAFAIGVLTNHYKNALNEISMPKLSIFIWLAHCLVKAFIGTWPWTYGLYLSTLLSAWVVISLYKIPSSKIDTLLGDLSYPIYLLHTTVAVWLLFYFDQSRSFVFFLSSFFLTICVSWILLIVFDHPIQRLKKRSVKININDLTVEVYVENLLAQMKSLLIHKYTIKIFLFTIIVLGVFVITFIYKIASNNTLEIYNWGPQDTIVSGEVPNKQPDGNAGLWIQTSMTIGLGKLEILVNGESIQTQIDRTLITGLIPKELFQNENTLHIEILHVRSQKYFDIGNLKVVP